jgi:hypothetical protein
VFGINGRPAKPSGLLKSVASDALRCCAPNSLLCQQPLAAGADLALDVVGNSGALPDSVNGDRVVLVTLEGHSLSSGY